MNSRRPSIPPKITLLVQQILIGPSLLVLLAKMGKSQEQPPSFKKPSFQNSQLWAAPSLSLSTTTICPWIFESEQMGSQAVLKSRSRWITTMQSEVAPVRNRNIKHQRHDWGDHFVVLCISLIRLRFFWTWSQTGPWRIAGLTSDSWKEVNHGVLQETPGLQNFPLK